jgi:hypothetical protein
MHGAIHPVLHVFVSGKNISDERNILLAYRVELYPKLKPSLFMFSTLLEILK